MNLLTQERREQMGREQALSCLRDPETFVRTFVSSGALRYVMFELYESFVTSKILPVIESLPTEKKMHYWQAANKEAAGTLTHENLKILSKGLYILDHLLKPYVNDTTEEQTG